MFFTNKMLEYTPIFRCTPEVLGVVVNFYIFFYVDINSSHKLTNFPFDHIYVLAFTALVLLLLLLLSVFSFVRFAHAPSTS